jgi:hypothetical protein
MRFVIGQKMSRIASLVHVSGGASSWTLKNLHDGAKEFREGRAPLYQSFNIYTANRMLFKR